MADDTEVEITIETLTGTIYELRISIFETILGIKARIQRLEGTSRIVTRTVANFLFVKSVPCRPIRPSAGFGVQQSGSQR